MINGWKYLSLVLLGVVLGACAKQVLVSDARAQGGRPRYTVVGASATAGGYEEDLNKYAAEGWRYVGPISINNGSLLVFSRD